SKDEIEKMTKDAQAHADEDKKNRELAESRNRLDGLIYSTEKSLKELGDKVSEAEKKKVEEALAKAKDALGKNDVEVLKQAEEALTAASHKIAEEMYRQASAKSPGAGSGSGPTGHDDKKPGGKEDVMDAEYKVDDDK
ncbi:MAG: Hsp70 family protein, partial [Candidatus Omnitrophica bacterium]|nr:Hsp70 family protein [Candidatus Omnitrophota bacterium]